LENGYTYDQIVSFTDFQVRDEASITTPMQTMLRKIEAEEHSIEIKKIKYEKDHATIRGRVLLPDFRREDGRIEYHEDSVAKPLWTPFVLKIPNAPVSQKFLANCGYFIKRTLLI